MMTSRQVVVGCIGSKKRHGIRQLSMQGESLSADVGASEEFRSFFYKFVEQHNFSPGQLFNCDETGLYWRLLPNKTLAADPDGEAHQKIVNYRKLDEYQNTHVPSTATSKSCFSFSLHKYHAANINKLF